ncbi:MAG: hypothetical protein U0746_13810 [Gemmataceae bacterium]
MICPGRPQGFRFRAGGEGKLDLGDGGRSVVQRDVRVAVHRQRNGRMAGQFLCVLRPDTRPHQLRHEPMAQGVEVGRPPVPVAVGQEVGPFAPVALGVVARFGDPTGTGGVEVATNEVAGFVVLRPIARPERLPRWRRG